MFFILIALLILLLFYNFYWKRLGLPPGPAPLPLIGNLISLKNTTRFEYKFLEWSKKYGTIYTYWLGETPVVAVNDAKLAYQMFVKDGENYVDRGIVSTDGQLWQDQRRFALRFLRDFGLGKNQMQDRILEEVHCIIKMINKDIDSGVLEHDLYRHTDISVGSIINSLVFGYRFTENNNEAEFYRLKDLTAKMTKNFSNPIVFLGFFNKWLGDLTRKWFPKSYDPIKQTFQFVDNQIKQRLKNEEVDEDAEPRDLVDAFLIEKAKQKRLNLPTADLYTIPQLRALAFDLWSAGQETTSSTLNWAIAYLIKFPEVQEKIHEELDKVIGSDRIITVSDKLRLNYLSAFILELQRAVNIAAQNVLRRVAQDTEVNGVKIRKGTFCIAQISAIHYDPEIFPEPEKVKPERFLKDGQLIRNDEKLDALMPFSLGKRACPGEGLARMELFLFIANLCNQYKFCPGKHEPILKKTDAGGKAIVPYRCALKRRFTS